MSILYPVSEARAVWRHTEAGAATRKVLDRLRSLKVLPADPEGRLWNMGASRFERLWRRAVKKAGLAYCKPHVLRHSFASILLSRGARLLEIQRAGGWKSATIMLGVYSKGIAEADQAESASTAASGGVSAQL